MLTVGSLFAGIGGIELGLERAGGGGQFKTVWQVENDEYATRVLEKHWPDAKRWGDVRTFPPRSYEFSYSWRGHPVVPFAPDVKRETTRDEWYVDLICGGFPCTDISYAGKGAGLAGEHSGLWYEYARIIRVLRPRYVLVENVAALLTRGLDAVLGTLASLGYDAEWHCIPAAAVGAPHIRDRVFILAYAIRPKCESGTGGRGVREGDSDAACTESGARRRTKKRKEEGRKFNFRSDGTVGTAELSPDTTTMGREEGGGVSGNEEETRSGWSESCGGGEDVGNADESPQDAHAETGEPRGTTCQSGWWSTEPDMGRVAHGVPFELVCLGRGVNDGYENDDSEADATRVWTYRGWRLLRSVWEHRELAATSPRLYQDRVLAAVPEVPRIGTYEGWYVGARIEKDEELRRLWEDFYAKSQQETQDMLPRLLERVRKAKRPQAVASRVDRLRCLGNAVVPQVAQWIGERILEAKRTK